MRRRDHFNKRLSALKNERSSFRHDWLDSAKFIAPRRGRFFTSDRNKGGRRASNIINSHGTMALRTFVAGLMSGATSPARPWFRYGTPDREMMEYAPVRLWLEVAEEITRAIFNAGNLYNALPTCYRELGLFGTAAMTEVEDFQDVARFYPHTIGSYYIANGERQTVNTFYLEQEMTVAQIVEKHIAGPDKSMNWSRASDFVKNHWDRGNYDNWVPVIHAIEPNIHRDFSKLDSKNKPFLSVRFEPGDGQDRFLSEKGFDEFPVMAPRWETTGEDIYATDCPAFTALGDIKALQTMERRKAQAIDKIVNPPLKGPGTLKNVPISSLPGGITIYDGNTTEEGLQPLYEVRPQVAELFAEIEKTEDRISRAFYEDLFLMISNMEGVQPRNVMELSQRQEEKLLMLGPALERLHGELLNPLIDRTFAMMVRADLLPPAPPELQGSPLRVEYISVLAQAQKAVGTGTIDRLAGYIGGLMGAGFEEAGDKFDADQSIDEYGELIGASPKLIRDDQRVAEIREGRARARQAEQQIALAQAGAQAMKTASEADLDKLTGIDSGQDQQ